MNFMFHSVETRQRFWMMMKLKSMKMVLREWCFNEETTNALLSW
jgi:hypothetical protein